MGRVKEYPHQILMKKHALTPSQLPDDVQSMITDWQNDASVTVGYNASLERVSNEIVEEIEEYLDEIEEDEPAPAPVVEKPKKVIPDPVVEKKKEPVIPAKPAENAPAGDEAVLALLYAKGTREIDEKGLKAAGLKTGIFSKLTSYGGNYGKYKLTKKVHEKNYQLSKIG